MTEDPDGTVHPVPPTEDSPERPTCSSTRFSRRTILMAALGGTVPYTIRSTPSPDMQPVVSEVACPMQTIEPAAVDGHRGQLIECKGVGASTRKRSRPARLLAPWATRR